MVRTIVCKAVRAEVPKFYFEFAGEHTDDKPTDDTVATGSLFHEVDTKKVYAYGEDSETWYEQMTLGE